MATTETDLTDEERDDHEIVRAKWCMDGATTLAEAAQKLRDHADLLDTLNAEGWELIHPVEDDYGCIRKT